MALYAIGDLHLCLGAPKPMDVFGGAWVGYMDKLKQGFSRVTDEDTAYVRSAYAEVKVPQDVLSYMMDIVEGTRNGGSFVSGVSTRGAIALYKAAQVTAALNGRDYVIPEDVRFVAPHVLVHHIAAGSGSKGSAADTFLHDIIKNIKVPLETV